MPNRKTVPCLLLVIILLLSSSCRNNEEKAEELRIYTLKGPSAISMVKMIEDNTKISQRTIHFEIENEPLQIRPSIFQKKADFAVVPTNLASIIYNKQPEYQLAAVPVWGTLYLFGSDSGITNWRDLKNRRIHLMAKGMTPDVMFRYLLKKNGLIPGKDVKLDYSFPTHIELANAVASGKAKLGVISEPLVSMVIQKNPGVKSIMSLNTEWKKTTNLEIPQTALLVKKELAVNSPEIVNKFLKQYQKSCNWITENSTKGAKLVVKHKILNNEKVAKNSIPRCNIRFEHAADIDSLIKNYLNIFYEMNPDIVGGKLPDEKFIYKK